MAALLPRKLLIALASPVAFAALAEAALRLADFSYASAPPPIILWDETADSEMLDTDGLHQPSARQLWEPRPGAPVTWGVAQGERIAADSHRGPERPIQRALERAGDRTGERALERAPGALRVVVLGDSTSFGAGVPYAHTYSAQLEQRLAAAGVAAEVIDFGVIGFTVRQGIERWRERASRWRPDAVVLAFGAFNDSAAGIGLSDDARIRRNLDGPRGLSAFVRALRERSRLVQLAARALDGPGGAAAARERRWAEILEERRRLDPQAGRFDFEGVRRVAPDEFSAELERLCDEVAASGARPILVSLPRRPFLELAHPVAVDYSRRIAALASARGFAYFDARTLFREQARDEAAVDRLFLQGDPLHPDRPGHALIAQGLAEILLAAPGAAGAGSIGD